MQAVISFIFLCILAWALYRVLKVVGREIWRAVVYLAGFRIIHKNTINAWNKEYYELEQAYLQMRKETQYAPIVVDEEKQGTAARTVGKGKNKHTINQPVYQSCFIPVSNNNGHSQQHIEVTLNNGKTMWVPYAEVMARYDTQ